MTTNRHKGHETPSRSVEVFVVPGRAGKDLVSKFIRVDILFIGVDIKSINKNNFKS